MQCCPLGSCCSVRAPRARRDMRPLVLEWRLSVRAWTFFSQPAWKNGDTGRDDEANELPSSESATKRERDFKLTFRLTIKEHEKKTNGHDMRRKGQGRTRAIIISQNSKCLHFLFYFTSLVTTRQCLIATHARLLVPFLRQCICAAFFGRWGSLLGRRD